MSKIKIITDSTSDLSLELLTSEDIEVIPLYVIIDDNTFHDGVDLDVETLYKHVETNQRLPKTAAPSPEVFYNVFKKWIDLDYDIIYIGLSSMISSTIQNVTIAKQEFDDDRIKIIDSLNLSTGIGLLVLKACDYRRQGLNIHQIEDKIVSIVPKVRTSFIIDTLDYLYMGGRCSALAHYFGGILHIRPVISVVDGKMILKDKIRGKRDSALQKMLDNALMSKDNIDRTRVMVTHSLSDEDAKVLKTKLEEANFADEILITNAGCVISSHCGPNTVGILYIEK